jgi:hypothetical protein
MMREGGCAPIWGEKRKTEGMTVIEKHKNGNDQGGVVENKQKRTVNAQNTE